MNWKIIIAIGFVLGGGCLYSQIQALPLISSERHVDITSFSGVISEEYSDGKPSLWKEVAKGKADGLWLEWYPNGQLRYRATWKDSKGHGRWEYFYSSGQLRSVSFYIDDIAQGIYRDYHSNGQLKTDLTYIDGKREGLALQYSEDGTLISRSRYEADQVVLDEPIVFESGNISVADDNEWGITFAPEGNEAYFTRRDHMTGKKRIYKSQLAKGRWSTPRIANFSTSEDESPFISQDGSRMYFASYKPLPNNSAPQDMDMNLWMMQKEESGWTNPEPIPGEINKAAKPDDKWPQNYEAGPVTDPDGNLYYWTKGKKTKASNIFVAKKGKVDSYEMPTELLGPSDDKYYDTSPYLTSDGKLMFFSSDDRQDGYGSGDIYYAKKIEGQWSEGTNLGPVVNSYLSEGFPSLSPDGKYLFFSSTRSGDLDANGEALWDIYYMETRFLNIK